MKKILLLCLLCFIVTGCSNYRELNELGITSAIGIEKKEDKFNLTIQVLDTNQSGDSKDNTPKFVIYNTEGNTIQEALRNIVNESSKRLYINHMQILLIDEKLANNGIEDVIDFFLRDPESRKQFLVLISKNDIKEVLSTETLLEQINGKSIKERTKTNLKYLGSVSAITCGEMIADYINPNKEIVLPSIELIEYESKEEESSSGEEKTDIVPKKRLFLSNNAVFKGSKLITYLDSTDSIYYNLIEGNINDTIITDEKDGKYTSIEIIDTKVDTKVKENNIDIKIKLNGSINDINYNVDLTKNSTIKEIEETFKNKLNSEIKDSISNIIDKYDSDIYGFKELIYKYDTKYFNDTNIELNKLNIKINTELTILYKGNGVDNIDEKN